MAVWVTRDEPEDGPLCTALRRRGVQVVLEPVIVRGLVADPGSLLTGLGADDWLVLTSSFAVEAVARVPAARVPRVAVVGSSSRDLAKSAGLRVALVSEDGHGDTLFDQLRQSVQRGVVCYPRSAQARAPAAWGEVEVRSPVLYETQPRAFDRSVAGRVSLAVVASPSAVKAIGDVEVPLASIGRTTSAAIRSGGREPVVESASPTFDDLAEAVAGYLRSSRHHRA